MFHTSIQKLNMSESQQLEVLVPSSDTHDHILIGCKNRLNTKKYLLTGSIMFSIVLLISVYTMYENYITCNYITAMISIDLLSCYAEKSCCQITYFTSHFFLHKYSYSCYEQNNNFDSLLNDHHHHHKKNATSKSDITFALQNYIRICG
jgi:hypothetical protein